MNFTFPNNYILPSVSLEQRKRIRSHFDISATWISIGNVIPLDVEFVVPDIVCDAPGLVYESTIQTVLSDLESMVDLATPFSESAQLLENQIAYLSDLIDNN